MSKPFVLRFKFRDFESLPSGRGDFVYSDRVTDRRNGNGWQLQLYPGGTKISDEGIMSVFLHNVDGPDVNARTAFIVRDAHGNVFHRQSSDDVDCYKTLKECFGYFTFINRADVLDEANSILLRGTLIIDIEVQTGSMPRRAV